MYEFIVVTLIAGLCAWFPTVIILMVKSFRAYRLFTPGRRTRGIAHWWSRCTRWTRNLHTEPHRPSRSTLRPEPWVIMTAALDARNDRPTPAEFAACPPLPSATVDRLLAGLEVTRRRPR